MIKSSVGVALAVMLIAGSGCSRTVFVEAKRCLHFDLRPDEGEKLLPALDSFARAHGLMREATIPSIPTHRFLAPGKQHAEMIYTHILDESGWELFLYRFDPASGDGLILAFDQFVERDIKPEFGGQRCANFPKTALPKAN